MLIETGAIMVGVSAFAYVSQHFHWKLRRTFMYTMNMCGMVVKHGKAIHRIKIKTCTHDSMVIQLPIGLPVSKFVTCIEALEQALGCVVRVKHDEGSIVQLQFGWFKLKHKVYYKPDMAEGIAIPLITPFGQIVYNFADESSCHMLIGGSTRMGKTVLLRLIGTHTMLATDGKCDIYFMDNKINDLWMFKDIPQIQIAETLDEAKFAVLKVVEETARRKALLKEKGDVVDLKGFRKKYPDIPINPIFIIIDEYGRFAEDEDFQTAITNIAETAGYLDVHLVISAQRPDVKDVLKPRIRANLLGRLAFTTADEANSMIVLGVPDAAHLGRIQGRAVLMDGDKHKVQVPYLPDNTAAKLLDKYRRNNDVKRERQSDNHVPENIPGNESRSDWFDHLS